MGNDSEQKKYNVGISLLRLWMCYEVLIDHFASAWNRNNAETSVISWILSKYEFISVPIFILLAFALSDYVKMSVDSSSMKKRFYRLIIPTVFWGVTYWIVLSIYDFAYGKENIHGISDLIWQIVFGHAYNRTLWFQADLIFLTTIVILLFKLLKNKTYIVLLFFSAISLYLQYSGINAEMFADVNWPQTFLGGYFYCDYVMHTTGRFVELMPYTFIGLLIYNSRVLIKDKENNKKPFELSNIPFMIGSIIIVLLLLNSEMFVFPPGYMYGGLYSICMAIATICVFNYLPFDCLPERVKRVINKLAKHTMAVYFMHILVNKIICKAVEELLHIDIYEELNPLLCCLIIYVICFVIAVSLSHIRVRFIRESMS